MQSFHYRTRVVLTASWLVSIGFGLQASNTAGMELRGGPADPVIYSVHVIREMDHVGAPFTQGLEFTEDGERLIETSGSYPAGTQSFVRALDPQSGAVLVSTNAGLDHAVQPGGRFIEGIVQLEAGADSHWFASTYEDHTAIEYDSEFNHVDEHPYPYEGWGFSRNSDRTAFLATNGSEHVMELTPGSFEVESVKTATCYGGAVSGINELEMVHDFQGSGQPALLGNVYMTRIVVALDPATMHCIGLLHLEGLGDVEGHESAGFHVANGIAFNQYTGTYIMTGKNWQKMFEVRLEEESAEEGGRARELMLARQTVQALLQSDSQTTDRAAKPHDQRASEVF